jgi:hypothetical protein
MTLIYEVQGTTLKVCWHTDWSSAPPTRFAAKEGDQQALLVFKKAPSAAAETNLPEWPGAAGTATLPTKVQLRLIGPQGMKVQTFAAKDAKPAPTRFMFEKPGTYRFKLSGIDSRKGANYYPTVEIPPVSSPQVAAVLANAYVQAEFVEDDFALVEWGNIVTKYYWIAAGADADRIQMSKTRPTADKGAVLAIVRLGGIDLEAEEAPPAVERPKE